MTETRNGQPPASDLVIRKTNQPEAFGLFDPDRIHDACGVGFIVDLKNRPQHSIVQRGLAILENLEHRGAVGADPLMGDGAGIMVQIPHAFFAKEMAKQGITEESFPKNTVFSVRLNPLRDGGNYGSKVGALAKCPTDPATKKPKLPAPGKHCDSVEGATMIGGNSF